MTSIDSIEDWRSVIEDLDWQRLIERRRRPFGLFTVSSDPQPDVEAWSRFADYCVERELMLTCSWGPNSTVLDDVVDFASLGRSIKGLPAAEPLTTWHDNEPLEDALEFFLGMDGGDLRVGTDHGGTDWVRIVLVVGDPDRADEIRRTLTALGPQSFEQRISVEEEREIRRDCLRRVIQRDGDLDELLADMSVTTMWGDLEVPLRSADLIGLLEDYLAGAVSAEQVGEWAEVLEMRDELEPEDNTFWLLSELAPPVGLSYPMTRERALSIIERLR
ncbi:DUF7684 family protein [Nocardioides massiliensis]|uniref:DUF7684 domain-containing protein n=1 Tax=Nocardioides massiliensis TaxID=1325935 RepID=A0ABT9NPM3_9ACTN|nr:hypothetical protein [Nocardioides massiliensis]MDP9822343.1 hypothetical protein [Nocardioides massiliensis]